MSESFTIKVTRRPDEPHGMRYEATIVGLEERFANVQFLDVGMPPRREPYEIGRLVHGLVAFIGAEKLWR